MRRNQPYCGAMPKNEKAPPKAPSAVAKVLRESSSGTFVVAPPAKTSKRFTSGQIRDAVRKVNAAKG